MGTISNSVSKEAGIMAKRKFIDKIFEEFERRLTQEIEHGYCSLTLNVENSLKTALSKTIDSSATMQNKVIDEITTMKENVAKVAIERKSATEPDKEDENQHPPLDVNYTNKCIDKSNQIKKPWSLLRMRMINPFLSM